MSHAFTLARHTVPASASRHATQHGPSGNPGSPHSSPTSRTPLPHPGNGTGRHTHAPDSQMERPGSHPPRSHFVPSFTPGFVGQPADVPEQVAGSVHSPT